MISQSSLYTTEQHCTSKNSRQFQQNSSNKLMENTTTDHRPITQEVYSQLFSTISTKPWYSFRWVGVKQTISKKFFVCEVYLEWMFSSLIGFASKILEFFWFLGMQTLALFVKIFYHSFKEGGDFVTILSHIDKLKYMFP